MESHWMVILKKVSGSWSCLWNIRKQHYHSSARTCLGPLPSTFCSVFQQVQIIPSVSTLFEANFKEICQVRNHLVIISFLMRRKANMGKWGFQWFGQLFNGYLWKGLLIQALLILHPSDSPQEKGWRVTQGDMYIQLIVQV